MEDAISEYIRDVCSLKFYQHFVKKMLSKQTHHQPHPQPLLQQPPLLLQLHRQQLKRVQQQQLHLPQPNNR